jgi:hypothetical protein
VVDGFTACVAATIGAKRMVASRVLGPFEADPATRLFEYWALLDRSDE